MEVIRYDASVELGTQYSILAATGVANSETDAITVKELDADMTSVAGPSTNTQATLYIDFTLGSLTSATVRVYGSYVASPTTNDWYQETVETDSSGAATLDKFSIVMLATTRIAYHIPIGAYKAMKITVASAGTITNSAIKLNLGLRTN